MKIVCFYMVKLSQLEIEKPAIISRIEGEGIESRRLHSMGLRPGCHIKVLRKRYDTIHCRVSTTEFAMRMNVADKIFVK